MFREIKFAVASFLTSDFPSQTCFSPPNREFVYSSVWKVVVPKTKTYIPAKHIVLSINTFWRFYPPADTKAIVGIDRFVIPPQWLQNHFWMRFTTFDY